MKRVISIVILAVFLCLMPVIAQPVSIGNKAPLFTAESDKGEIDLQDYLGEKYVIIAFYFAINTSA